MNFIDIIILALAGWGIYKGFSNGIIKELAQIVAFLAAIYVASHFGNFLADFLIKQFSLGPNDTKLIAFLLAFLLTLIVVFLIARYLTKMIDSAKLGIVNRVAGAAFAAAKYLLILSFLLNLFIRFDPAGMFISKETREKSLLFKKTAALSPLVFPYIEKVVVQKADDNNVDESDILPTED